ncbi:MAG: hypothetical protein F4Y38_10770 [Gemmatimonadetes bacterium]|nr:hypothetical protein [Gemmatimonadota bacterium]MYG86574.1 hypothetical protein [Gemmatimonadota bacterium]MYJ89558.1 hypothetical protein [Gemmatimonadota bacterium]
MSVELIGIISVGVALAGVSVALAGLILASKRDINLRLVALEKGQADLRERMARLEGILECLVLRLAERIDPE